MHLADIAQSIFAGLGLDDQARPMLLGESPHGRECLFLIDGFGADVLSLYADQAPHLVRLFQHSRIETSFPSTTATSLTTLTTGEMPGIHGMLGYTVRVPRSGGRVLNALKWDERVDPSIWQPIPTLFERASQHGIKVSHIAAKRYEGTGFTKATFRGAHYLGANTLEDMAEKAKISLRNSPSFAYVYVNELDVAGHSDGVGSEKWLIALSHVDHVAQVLMANLPSGTRFWVSSDHGMVNAGEKVILGVDNDLLNGIETIAGEPRARHLYLDEIHLLPSASSEVVQKWREYFGARANIYSRQEAIDVGLFGPSVSIDSQDRIGDIVAVANGNLVLVDPARANLESLMVGHHGALTDAERYVPLLSTVIGG